MTKITLFFLLFTGFIYSQEEQKSLTVYFNSNNFSINLEAETVLNSFFSDEEITVSTIEIDGFCDDIGSLESNKILSLKRANSVAEYLQDNFNLEADSYEGKGEIEVNSSAENIDEIRENNRKSIVKVAFSKTPKKITPTLLKTYSGYKKFEDDLKIGDKILIENIVFKGSLTHFVDDEIAERELSKIVKYLNENSTAEIEIQGHVCCISKSFTDARDIESGKNNLSETRAKKIYDFLISKGISKNRMTHAGFGRQFPIPNTDEMLNKRVEVVIVKT
jgi:outer membrane protein OmpA-like peptidoglycan-associated protein